MNTPNIARLVYLKQFKKMYKAGQITLEEYLFILKAELDNIPKEVISA